MLAGLYQPAKDQTSDKGGNEAAAMQRLCSGETPDGKGDHRNLQPTLRGPARPPTEPDDICSDKGQPGTNDGTNPEFLDKQVKQQSGFVLLVASEGRDGQKSEEDGHADAIVQPAFEAEPLANLDRDILVGHNRLAERSIRGRQDRRQDCHADQREIIKDQNSDNETKQDGERQADQDQPLGNATALGQNTKIRLGGIDEQDKRQSDFGYGAKVFSGRIDLQKTQTDRPHRHAEPHEDHGAVDQGPFKARGQNAVGKCEDGDDCKGFVGHGGHGLAC